jgi:hypothetical protein
MRVAFLSLGVLARKTFDAQASVGSARHPSI